MAEFERVIGKHGGYRRLKSFQVAQLVYDVTVRFCERYIEKFSRTRDQMVQAARSGVQNIAEGSQASGTSKKTELKLTSVARASLEELRLDYEDFLRQRGLRQWDRDDACRARLIGRRPTSAAEVAEWVEEEYKNGRTGHAKMSTKSMSSTPSIYSEIAANGALALIAAATTLLERQMSAQEEAFKREGGFTERMYRVRQKSRRR
ncbi:MAG: four helix bundle protein [Sedimentisphaerales bacterium]|nr:four helix bundle protein [Sedimentisphaerales bacterium]